MLAKVVSYGGNSVRYALEKENAKTVKVNNMPDGLDPTAIWYMMKHHCQYHQAERTVGRKLERFMTTFVLSPSKEESANFTIEDWSNLQDEALEVLDSVGLTPNGFSNEVGFYFIGTISPHHHMRCDKCGRVTDIPADAVPEICSCAAKATGLRITGCSILFHGVCRDCEQN